MTDPERRQLLATHLEVRELNEAPPTITGYAIVWNAWSQTLYDWGGGGFRERFAPTAFDAWFATDPELVALWNHNADYPLARRSRGALRIAIDAYGLHFEIDPPPTTWGDDALVAIRRGDVAGMSFMFDVVDDIWERPTRDDIAQRTILAGKLYEISPVTFPAYPAATVTVRGVRIPEIEATASTGQLIGAAADQLASQRRALLEVRRRRLSLLATSYRNHL